MAKPRTLANSVAAGGPLENGDPTIADVTGLQAALDAKQATLVSGTNIKTINGGSLLGSGDLTVGGGSLIFLQEVVASNSAEVDLTAFSSTYDDYVVIFDNALSQSSNNQQLICRFLIAGTWRTSNYNFLLQENRSGNPNYRALAGSGQNKGLVTDTMYSLNSGGTYAYNQGTVTLLGVNTTGKFKSAIISSVYYNDVSTTYCSGFGHVTNDGNGGVLSGIRFEMSGSPMATGRFRLYGIKKS